MRLRTPEQYRRMGQQTFKFTGQWIFLNLRITAGPLSRLGITVTRRYGSAPQRNRFKRLTREAFRLLSPHLGFTFDVVVRPRSQALQATKDDIQKELLYFIEKAYMQANSKIDI